MSDGLVPFFMPSLSAILVAEEDKKGEPLSREKVLKLRDGAACIMMKAEDAEKMHESRGYRDIDPENCWCDWQMLRREMGRQPDLEPGPRYGSVKTSDPAYQATIEQAQASLDEFRSVLPSDGTPSAFTLIKSEVVDGENTAVMWLHNTAMSGDSFTAELFEVPDSLPGCRVGDRLTIGADEILDWMINDGGLIHGGYSLRYQREHMSASEQAAFDKHIGATGYA